MVIIEILALKSFLHAFLSDIADFICGGLKEGIEEGEHKVESKDNEQHHPQQQQQQQQN